MLTRYFRFHLYFSLCAQLLICIVATGGLSFAHKKTPQTGLKRLSIPVEKYKLKNGLEVILSENHELPLVAVNIWYHVGPANERPGLTGFAHLFEHMMFEGSEHVPANAHFRYLEAAGATSVNATTDFDRTNYFETVPTNQLELALWLESDRMGFFLKNLDQEKLANQRAVVRNERRQREENPPYALVREAVPWIVPQRSSLLPHGNWFASRCGIGPLVRDSTILSSVLRTQ